MNSRYPVYALAELSVESTLGAPHEDVIDKILEALVGAGYLKGLGDVG